MTILMTMTITTKKERGCRPSRAITMVRRGRAFVTTGKAMEGGQNVGGQRRRRWVNFLPRYGHRSNEFCVVPLRSRARWMRRSGPRSSS